MQALLYSVIAEFVSRPVNQAASYAASREPHRVAVGVVVATVALGERSPSELPAPDDQGLFQEPARLEILDQSRDRPVDFPRRRVVPPRDLAMVVPFFLVAAVRALHEPHAPLDQPSRDQALPSEVACRRIVHTVEPARGLGLPVRGQRLGRLHLHAERQLERLDASFDFGLVPLAEGVPSVYLLQHVQLVALLLGSQVLADQMLDRLALDALDRLGRVADRRALEGRWQERRTPILLPAVPEGRLDRDESGQVPILGSEAVQHPRPDAGTREVERAGMQLQHRAAMVHGVADHRAHHAEVVSARAHMREQTADRGSALAVRLEFERRSHQAADFVRWREGDLALDRQRLAFVQLQARLGVEGVQVRGPAMHEEKDDVLRFRGEVRGFRRGGIGSVRPFLLGEQGVEAECRES